MFMESFEIKKEWEELSEINLSKAQKLLENFEKLPVETIKSSIGMITKAMDNTASFFKNKEININKDLLVVKDNLYSRSMEEFIETYFLIKRMLNKDWKKLGDNKIVIGDWKNNIVFEKEELLALLKKVSYLKERLVKLSELDSF